MKTTSWLCPILTLLCATKVVYTTQRGSNGDYPLEVMNSQMLQDDGLFSKRNKPSLSIVNPLDVLRQRLLLEIARRQMKENTRQVELNRAILNNVGKRMAGKYPGPLTPSLYDVHDLQQQQQQQKRAMQFIQPYPYEYTLPTTSIFDYLLQQQQQHSQRQRQAWLPYETSAIQFANNYIDDGSFSSNASENDANTDEDNAGQDINAVVGNNDKHSLKHIKQSNGEHATTLLNEQRDARAFQKSINNRDADTKRFALIDNHELHHPKNNLNLDLNDASPMVAASKSNANDYKNEINDNGKDYQLQRYLYHLHKNQNLLTRK